MLKQIRMFSILLVVLLSFGCSVNKQQVNKNYINAEQVAFVEFIQTQDGKVISGDAPKGRRIDGPTYRFDSETKKLEIIRKENFLLDTVKVILGNGRILKGAAGSGLSMRINAIGKLPYSMYNLTIKDVNAEGLSINFDGKSIVIKEGEKWETTTSTIDTIKMETPAIINFTTTYLIKYHGLIDKKNILQ